ncbi:MAG: hypothetical protein IJT44_08610 [Clostridia bacterium]|nr:hypothetical protein [Clostridia bacterium]
MWDEAALREWLQKSTTHCALFLTRDGRGKAVVLRADSDGVPVPCRIAQTEKSALRSMRALFWKTADPAVQKTTVAFAAQLWPAAMLAGLVGGAVTFSSLDPALGDVALLYSGSLRTSPPV